jgi:acyl carrier protein
MNEQMIKNEIISIMKNKLCFEFNEKMDEIEHQNFFSKHFNLAPFELAYLLMEVEKDFNISIPEAYLIDPGVKTIGHFTKYIMANQVG